MSVNKKILLSGSVDNSINIPVDSQWELLDVETDIALFEERAIKELIGVDKDFELNRFVHADYQDKSALNYEFYFHEGPNLTSESNWKIDYRNIGFTTQEIYYYANSFKNSFFKLDFYDSPIESEQTNYITVIIPTQQGERMTTQMQTTNVLIKKPQYILNYVGDKEGFFIYWLKKRNFIDVTRFYMTAKFFDAKVGQFVRMLNRPQSSIPGNKFNFSQSQYLYYRVDMDYEKRTYMIYDTFNVTPQRVGGLTPIKWYEYINP